MFTLAFKTMEEDIGRNVMQLCGCISMKTMFSQHILTPLVSLAETKSEHQWLSEPTRNKTASKYMLTFTLTYKNRSQTWRTI